MKKGDLFDLYFLQAPKYIHLKKRIADSIAIEVILSFHGAARKSQLMKILINEMQHFVQHDNKRISIKSEGNQN